MIKRWLLLGAAFIFSIGLIGQPYVYYVSPTGSDSNSGTIDSPWGTWQKAFDEANAGDTVYFRGGVWYPTSEPILDAGDNSGTYNNWITYINYPGETPVLDCSNYTDMDGNKVGLSISYADYVKFIGLTVRNASQAALNQSVSGVSFYECGNLYIERFVSHGHGGYGFRTAGYDTLWLINTDVYDCLDDNDTDPGNTADGFAISSGGDIGDYTIITGCRSWNNADDAFEINPSTDLYVYNNWAFGNGRMNGSGKAYRFGTALDRDYYATRKAYNNISTYNNGASFSHSHAQVDSLGYTLQSYNNTSYNNNYVGFMEALSQWDCDTLEGKVKFANNISYNDYFLMAYYYACANEPDRFPYYITTTHNTWTTRFDQSPFTKVNDTITVTDDDFVALLDSTSVMDLMSSARDSDGSLPSLGGFLSLRPTSDLIDAGVDVGLPYSGSAPDVGYSEYTPGPQIIADHSIVDDYELIPQYYIDSIKKMWLSYPGESHSEGIRDGLALLEAADPTYAVNVTESGTPEAYTDDYLRVSRATWGDRTHATGWIYSYGEEDWFTNSTAIARTKSGLTYTNTNGPALSAMGFGWCWDLHDGTPTAFADPVYNVHWYGVSLSGPDGSKAWGLDADDYTLTANSVSMDTYLSATEDYIDYCADSIPTKIFYTTGPVDDYEGYLGLEAMYQATIKYDYIRDYVDADTTRILFDYADILCYDDGSEVVHDTTWNSNDFPFITRTNVTPVQTGHISNAGALRLGKAMWWMLARMAGWDGVTDASAVAVAATDILTFTFPSQTGAATINATNHTVAIEVDYTADVTDLTPTITLSYGATVIPASGVSRNFTSPLPYTVTALDGVTTQEWTVTVTQEAEPATPAGSGLIVKYKGKIIKR